MTDMLIIGLPFVFILLAGIAEHVPDDWFLYWWATGAVIAVVGLVRQIRRFKFYNCPDCSKQLVNDKLVAQKPITFTCEKCKTSWDSGFIHSVD